MALAILESLVLRGVSVAGGEVAGPTRLGSKPADGKAPVSYPRYPSQTLPQSAALSRRFRANFMSADEPANRAGRPGSLAGVLGSRSPAMPAGRALFWPAVA